MTPRLESWQSKTFLPALAEDVELNYQQVVELKLLLEQLQQSAAGTENALPWPR